MRIKCAGHLENRFMVKTSRMNIEWKKWLFGLVGKDILLCLPHFSLDSLPPHVQRGWRRIQEEILHPLRRTMRSTRLKN
jgi:hypothetical protein